MGLSPLLVDSYRRYKRDTKTFMQWLGTTAHATGLADNIFQDGSDKQQLGNNTGHKKGKNRKPRKKVATVYRLSVKALASLANVIQQANNGKVPRHIMTVLGDIIKARKACAAWYRAHQTGESHTTNHHNEGHGHIISVLEEVYQVLSPLQEKSRTEKKDKSYEIAQVTNLFGLLEIEECPNWQPKDAWVPIKAKQEPENSYEPAPSPEDVSFALYCFMKDITDIRIFIRRTWRDYKHGRMTINSTASASNTAMDVIYRLNEVFLETFPQFADHESVIDYLYNDYIDPNAKVAQVAGDHDFASYEGEGVSLSSKTFFCDHTVAIIKKFYESGVFPMYPRHLTKIEGIHEDEHILLQCLSHFNIVDWQLNGPQSHETGNEIFLDDQVLRAVRKMRVDKKFPTWAVFACQIFVDIRRELDKQVSHGYEDLRNEASWLLKSWAECLDTGKENGINNFHERNDKNAHNCITSLKAAAEQDFVQEMINDYFKEHPEKIAQYSWEECFLLKNHPTLCGLIIHKSLVSYHRLGIRIAADQGPVRTAMHLTHAVALTGLIPIGRAWADLEYIIRKHGDPYLFVGERPTKLFDCSRRMSLAFGSSASNFSLNKNLKADSRIIKGARDPPSHQKLHRRLRPISRYVEAYEKQQGIRCGPTRAASDTFVMMEHLVNRLIHSKDLSCPANPYNDKCIETTCHMTPLQSLRIFKQALKEDDFALRFDFASLNWRCVQLLRRIQKICLEMSPLDYPSKKWGGDYALNGFIIHMFAGVAGVARDQPTRFLEACALVCEVIVEEGNVEYLKAEARVGIKMGTAVDPEVDPENFEDPVHNFVHPKYRGFIHEYSAEKLARFKSRGEDETAPVRDRHIQLV
jgi:hypothetical protein